MKKIIFALLSCILFQNVGFTQKLPPLLEKDWKRVFIKDVGSIDLPPTMEIPKGKYKEDSDLLKGTTTYVTSNLEINSKKPSKTEKGKHASIFIDNTVTSPGDYKKLNYGLNNVSQKEIDDLNKIIKKSLSKNSEAKLIEYYPLKIKLINGMYCMNHSFIRQVKNKPYEFVSIYLFNNNDRAHQINLYYDLSEEIYWKADFAKIIDSFRITNIK
ncbi:MAG: hypothetical protein IPP30_04485 [Flavobacterium sp.]|nr:hypothetical protein [Flavobacterium sp.]